VLDDQEGGADAVEAAQDRLDLTDARRIDARDWFVQHHHLRFGHQRRRKRNELLLAIGQYRDLGGGVANKSDQLD